MKIKVHSILAVFFLLCVCLIYTKAITAHAEEEIKGDPAEVEADNPAREPFEPSRVDLMDGEYAIEVTMTGGSGRASVSSPTIFVVKEGRAHARLLWSSVHYDYMIVGGEVFYNETTDGSNSTFTIPIKEFDRAMPVVADTTALGYAVPINYELVFYYETINDKSYVPQEAAKRVIIFALAIIVLGGILNFFVKKKRKA